MWFTKIDNYQQYCPVYLFPYWYSGDMSQATELTNAVIDYIYRQEGFAYRAESSGVFDSKLQLYRTAPKKGVSDIIGIYKGKFLAVEIKIGKDRLSPEQIGFLKNIAHCGGYTFVAKDLPSFQEWFTKNVIHK